MIKVLALDPIHEAGLALLRTRQDIELVHLPQPDKTSIAQHMANAEILILRGRHLNPTQFDTAKSLRLVSRHGVGCDNLDFAQMGRNGVTVAVSADANYVSVAEHAVALMLAACRNLIMADQAARIGDWGRRDTLGGQDVQGSEIVVVGFGRIGQAFAARAAAFGGEVTVFDPYLPADITLPVGMKRAGSLGAAVGEADIVSLHLPHSPQTANMVDAALLAQFRAGAILVNTGRGGIVEEQALLAALDAGRPAIYATDVLASEPPILDNPLLFRNDVIVTPHTAAMTKQGIMRMATGAAQNTLDFLDGKLADRMVAFAPS